MTRREFLAASAATGAGLIMADWLLRTPFAEAFYQTGGLRKFVQPLRGVGPGGIPVAIPDRFRAPVTGVTHYSLGIRQFTDRLHPDLGPTALWGYEPAVALGGTQPQRHL
ncbi:MAG: twin-arginine translocation signal domain-containing protein, partial [Ktedonobacterales bacterium]